EGETENYLFGFSLSRGFPCPEDLAPTPEGFARQMRQLKRWSGLSFRDIELRAQAGGRALPRSTLGRLLSGGRRPDRGAVETFVQAVGGTRDDIEEWLRAWQQPLTQGRRRSSEPRLSRKEEPEAGISESAQKVAQHSADDTNIVFRLLG